MSRKGAMHCSTLVGRGRHCPNSRLKYPVKEPLIKLMLHTIRMERLALPPVMTDIPYSHWKSFQPLFHFLNLMIHTCKHI